MMFSEKMRQIKEKAIRDLEDMASDNWTAGKAETAAHLSTIVKNMCKLEEMSAQRMGQYSGDGRWVAYGGYGHPMSHGMPYGGDSYGDMAYGSYGDGSSGARHWVRGHYSRGGAMDNLKEQIREQLRNTTDPRERERLESAISAMDR